MNPLGELILRTFIDVLLVVWAIGMVIYLMWWYVRINR